MALIAHPPGAGAEADASIESAEALLGRAESARAAEAFAAILAHRPGDVRAMAGRLEALLDLDRWREALAQGQEFRGRAPESAAVRSALGTVLFRAGEIEEADRLLTASCGEPGARPRAQAVLGSLRSAQGRPAEAADWMDRAVAAAADDCAVWFRAAEATRSRAEAVARLERYVALSERDDPDRREAARGTLAALRALGERRVWILGPSPPKLEILLEPAGGVDSPGGGFVFRARLGVKGRPARLLLDSGSSGLFLVERVARKVGFEPLAEETTFGGGGDQRHPSRRGVIPRVALGALEFRDALATSSGREVDPAGRYQGVIGLSAFDDYRIALDFERRTIGLSQGEGTPAEGEPYWTVSGQLLVRAAATGGPDGIFLLDTGADRTVVDLDFASGVPGARLREAAPIRGFGGGVSGARVVEGVEIAFQGARTPSPRLGAVDLSLRSRLSGIEIAGYLGLDVLSGAVLVIDPASRRVELRRKVRR